MDLKAGTARSYLEQMLTDENAEPKALPLSLLEDITGDFSPDQVIGSGGFAVVYKGILGDRVVAVKKLSDALMDEKKFHREIKLLMQVKHKNVVRFLGYCADRQGNMKMYNGELVMADVHQRLLCFEYIAKESLDKYIMDAQRDWGMCYKIIIGICEGLQYLHENHIAHLDLKPTNILLDNNMIPKITDFGLSRCFKEDQSRDITKTIQGTLGYMAPEVHVGVIACRADLYSLGVIIIEILTGAKAHQDTDDVLESWSDRLEISQRDTLREQIRVCYETAIECRDFNPKKRPASAQNIIERLRAREILTAEATSSRSGVAATESSGEGNTDDPTVLSLVPDAETGTRTQEGKTVAMPSAASTSPRHATLHAMAATHPPPDQTVVFPRPAGPSPAQSLGSAYDFMETKPLLPAKLGPRSAAAKIPCTYDMVELMSYLYVTVVKARDLRTMEITDSPDLYVEVKMGKFKGVTRHLEKNDSPEWRQTFAFSRDQVIHRGDVRQLEVIVKDKDGLLEGFVGHVIFAMSDVPSRLPSDSSLAPQWYQLSDADGNNLSRDGHGLGEIMLAIWLGTQADDAFPGAWHAVAQSLSLEGLTSMRSKIYYSPKLIYLKVSVIAAYDLVASEAGRPLAATIAKIQMGNQIRRTSPRDGTANPVWNEELMFVVCKPLVDPLLVTVEERIADGRDEPIGRVIIEVAWPQLPRNDLARSVPSKWYSLSRGTVDKAMEDVTTVDEGSFASKIRLKMSLETAYHMLDESIDYSSDLQPVAKNLRRSAIGILEVGILGARGLGGMKNPYCVAKYGAKWVRTRTLLATAELHWNEQYVWEVFDLSTVITIVVFDNANLHQGHGGHGAKDQRIGKVRFRLTTLESGQVHTHYYPLMALNSSGPKKTGELHLAVRFTCKSWVKMMVQYGRPLLPEMHYTNPISVLQREYLQFEAMHMVANRLERANPPLRREVVEYMLDHGSQFSLRRSKANFYRLTALFRGAIAVDDICKWKNPPTTVLIHVVFLTVLFYPDVILPSLFLCMIMIGAWNYTRRPRRPPHIDMILSHAELAHPDELDEELDTLQPPNIDSLLDLVFGYAEYPDEKNEELHTSTNPDDIVRMMRYDRLRSIASRIQPVVGDLATMAERAESLLRWRDPWVTSIFITLSLVVAVVLYLTPIRLVAMVMGLYFLRPPWIRSTDRSRTNLLFNFYTRLPSKDDMIL